MKTARVYFAHSKKIYGTKEEKKALAYLRTQYSHVTCPNNDIGELGAMAPYLTIVNHHDMVVAKEFEGLIGKGVYSELINTQKRFVLREQKGKYIIQPIKKVSVVNEEDWYHYAKIN